MMRTQLITAGLAVALAAAGACNRAQTQQQTHHAAAEVKTAAARAGDALSDGWLTTRIQAQYFADDQIKARYVNVSTSNGVVTVKGFVDSPGARERALQIAKTTDGVKQVNDQLLIGQSPKAFEASQQPVATTGTTPAEPAATVKPDDGHVTASIQARYFLDGTLKTRHIDVDTREGVVTVKGEVGSEDERAQALLLARTTPGVDRVEDNLSVNVGIDPVGTTGSTTSGSADAAATASAHADDDALTSAVKSKLGNASGIDVSAKDGVVMLEGTVASAAAKQKALAAARQADGVTQVVDRLRVRK
jgi:hyperosmotically inducible protein